MKHRTIKNRFWIAAAVACLFVSTGCNPLQRLFTSGGTININIPLGLSGNPGFFNPFGLTQALFDAISGANTQAGDNSGGDTNDNGGDAEVVGALD